MKTNYLKLKKLCVATFVWVCLLHFSPNLFGQTFITHRPIVTKEKVSLEIPELQTLEFDTANYEAIKKIIGNLKLKCMEVDDTLRVSVGVMGDLKKALSGNNETEASTGSLALNFQKGQVSDAIKWGFNMSGMVSVAALDDIIESEFGLSLLTPRSGKNSAVIDIQPYKLLGKQKNASFFIHSYAYISSTTWQYVPVNDPEPVKLDGSILGAGLLLGLQLFKQQKDNEKVNFAAISLQAGLAYRTILGDLKSDESFRMNTLGIADNSFRGLEIGLSTLYNGLTASLSFYYFGEDVSGLSKGQVTGGLSVAVDLHTF